MKANSKSKGSSLVPVRTWDVPVRAIHAALVFFVSLSWLSAEAGFQNIHVLSGYSVLILALVRLYWGFVGSTAARFGSFVRGPGVVLSYARQVLKRPGIISAGHNPMGAVSVVVMLGLLLVQPTLGLFAKDINGLHSGPFSHLVSFRTGRLFAELHHLAFELLLIFIALHIVAVVFYVVYKRDRIISAMISGYKDLPPEFDKGVSFVPLRRAVIALGITAALILFLHFLGSRL